MLAFAQENRPLFAALGQGVALIYNVCTMSDDLQPPIPLLSIVVIEFNMAREVPRTILSLSPAMQRGLERDEYEIILVDMAQHVGPIREKSSRLARTFAFIESKRPRLRLPPQSI